MNDFREYFSKRNNMPKGKFAVPHEKHDDALLRFMDTMADFIDEKLDEVENAN